MVRLVHNVQKKQHRERSQPQERKRWGLLEKKKDYKLRADDYHKKQAALKVLKVKAANKNEDEYYHSMVSNRSDGKGIVVAERGNESLGNDEVSLLKTQDSNYINVIRTKELKAIEKLSKNLNFHSKGKHVVFVGSNEEKLKFDPAEYFGTDERLLNKRENRLKLEQLVGENNQNSFEKKDMNKISDYKEKFGDYNKNLFDEKKLKKFKLLKARLEREAKLKNLQQKMDQQRELMKKGSKKKSVDKNGKVSFKWKNERKK
ncbi:hypothetical protein PACTADRAFT_34906 [Pachysolen tannophilus NRRL Y-2460]|uniref:U3 small nucleolar RNA-associated protein 11 n=1 Tax=Pachysolen tannophilus NRRL Y-2460 TaxID=669874 RepID=A0A1E4TQQ0_PACTA|nr:hypothetical protein PACTADRAFT_34906 [Pachysolen tannophilus NRRL Y-2460]